MPESELKLIRRAKSDDRAEMAELLSAHAEQSCRLGLHILGNEADARAATQNALIGAFTSLGGFEEGLPFSPGVLRIVLREALKRKGDKLWLHKSSMRYATS